MVEVFCDSLTEFRRRLVLDIDDTEGRVHGGHQLGALWNTYYDSRCCQPIHIEGSTGKPMATILAPVKRQTALR